MIKEKLKNRGLNGCRGSGRTIKLLCEVYENKIAEFKDENNKLLDVINNQDVKIADLEQQIAKMKCCENCDFNCQEKSECLANNYKFWELKE